MEADGSAYAMPFSGDEGGRAGECVLVSCATALGFSSILHLVLARLASEPPFGCARFPCSPTINLTESSLAKVSSFPSKLAAWLVGARTPATARYWLQGSLAQSCVRGCLCQLKAERDLAEFPL